MIRAAILAPILLAQAQTQTPMVFRSGVETVRVDVMVTRRGAPVPGLAAEDFQLTDNGVLQAVTVVDREAVPTTALLALDRSASVDGEKLARLQAAARAFLAGLRPRDSAALLTFDHRIELRQAPTLDRDAVATELDRVAAGGASSVVDALYVSLKRSWGTGLPLVVLFTDGEDAGSWTRAEDLLQAAAESATLLHVVGTESPGLRIARGSRGAGFAPVFSESGFVSLLRRAAEITGGAYWPAEPERLEATFLRVLAAADSRYVLSYEPRGGPAPGRHQIRVSVRRAGVTVRARQEYVAPE